ncbi:MAG: 4a-hydroxytetrahydrobiopterin dehydratase [Ornithinibacter sp.]
MSDDRTTLTGAQVEEEGIADWRVLFWALHARFRTGDFATGLRLVNRIAEAAEAADHHPDVELRYGHVHVRLFSHDVFGVTARDVRLARTISELAAEEGVVADPTAVQVLEIARATDDPLRLKPFWRAVLGLADSPLHDQELVDPTGVLPTVWFQRTEPHDEPRQRFHLDLRVPPELVQGRLEAALAAGGTLVSDEHAPAFWVLADPDGNKVCLTTWRGRD